MIAFERLPILYIFYSSILILKLNFDRVFIVPIVNTIWPGTSEVGLRVSYGIWLFYWLFMPTCTILAYTIIELCRIVIAFMERTSLVWPLSMNILHVPNNNVLLLSFFQIKPLSFIYY